MEQETVTAAPAPPAVVVEVLARDGRVQQVQRVTAWPARIGRSPACAVVLDDPHLAPEHAELDWSPEAGLQLRLLPSQNGGCLAGERLALGEATALPASAGLSLGGVNLRVRSSAEAMPPELVLTPTQGRHWALLPGLMLLMLAMQWFERWSSVDPDSRWIDYATPLLGLLAFVLGWAGLWSLATQLFQHRFPFAVHLRRILLVVCAVQVLEWLLPLVAYSLSWPRLMVVETLLMAVASAGLIWWHARVVWPGAQRILGGGIALLTLLGLGLQVGGRLEQQYVFGPPYLASIGPPALRLAPAKPVDTLIESLRPLQAELNKQARKDNEDFEVDGNE